jgi:phosphoketolase
MSTDATACEPPSAYGEAHSTIARASLDPDEPRLMDADRRASRYLYPGMIYLKDNPVLREPPTLEPRIARARHRTPEIVGRRWEGSVGA